MPSFPVLFLAPVPAFLMSRRVSSMGNNGNNSPGKKMCLAHTDVNCADLHGTTRTRWSENIPILDVDIKLFIDFSFGH